MKFFSEAKYGGIYKLDSKVIVMNFILINKNKYLINMFYQCANGGVGYSDEFGNFFCKCAPNYRGKLCQIGNSEFKNYFQKFQILIIIFKVIVQTTTCRPPW